MSFKFDPGSLLTGLISAPDKADAAIRMYADTSAIKLQNFAKQNRPWTDRTGQARQRLTGTSYRIANGYRLELAHGVDYGIWLELAHEKKYSIIPKTIQYVGTYDILPGLKNLLDRLG